MEDGRALNDPTARRGSGHGSSSESESGSSSSGTPSWGSAAATATLKARAARALLRRAARQLARDAADFAVPPGGQVPRVASPQPLVFLRDHVAQSRPCVLTGLLDEWDLEAWSPEALARAAGDAEVRVNFTPDGRGDCVIAHTSGGEVFVKPSEETVSFASFLSQLSGGAATGSTGVPYLSTQNDNLRSSEMSWCPPVPAVLPIAAATLGNVDALNIWLGDERSVSSCHQDVYDNMYAVLHGEKVFHLMPPQIHPGVFLGERSFRPARYARGPGGVGWEVMLEEDGPEVPWIPSEVFPPPKGAPWRGALLEVRVHRGEVLFIPSLWLHRVTQTCQTVAVNWWHEYSFSGAWCQNSYVGAIAELGHMLGGVEGLLDGDSDKEEEEQEEVMDEVVAGFDGDNKDDDGVDCGEEGPDVHREFQIEDGHAHRDGTSN
jgi:jumonji domain-containing protein 7